MDCFPVCQRGLPKKVGIRYNEHNSNRNEVTVNKIDITVQYLSSYKQTIQVAAESEEIL